ncbi:DUF5684 domain-containing protein [Microbacterium sp. P03]|uniref:DUF5684 domain-containing protein n=1 Tax=Microbacterium sp. P03 TaxID=3366946 RepID=UPI0037466F84
MDASTQAVTVFVIIGSLLWVLVGVLLWAWYAVALSGVFARLGVPTWRAWVPFLNEAEILRLGGHSPWLVLLYLVPIANVYAIYLRVRSVHRIDEGFGRGVGTTVLGMLLPPVWATILAVRSEATDSEPGRRMAAGPSTAPVTGPLAALQGLAGERPDAAPVTPAVPAPVISAPAMSVPVQPAPALPSWRPAPPLPVPGRPAPLGAVRPVSAPPPAPPAPAVPAFVVDPRAAAPSVRPPAPVVAPAAPSVSAVSHPAFAPTAAASAQNALVPPTGDAPILVHRPGAASDLLPETHAQETHAQEQPGEHDPDHDTATAVVDRRPRVRWELVIDDGRSYELSAPVVVLGRRPVGAEPGVQYLAVADTSRSVSKEHARLTLEGERWAITDLGSTNGVFVLDDSGAERELTAHEKVAVAERASLGDVGFRLRRREVA